MENYLNSHFIIKNNVNNIENTINKYSNRRQSIDVYSPIGESILKHIYDLTIEHPHYESEFILNFNGNIFCYSKKMDDSYHNNYIENSGSLIEFADFNYHYYLDLSFQLENSAIEDKFIDECISLLETNKCPMFDESDIYNEEANCPSELTEMYYERILHKIDNDIWLLKSWISDLNEANIIFFKKWFLKKFNGEEEESKYSYYNWSIKFTQFLIHTSLDYVKEDYSIHETGGGSEFFFNKMNFLHCIAKEPFEAELFELIEDDGGIYDDED